MKKNWQVDLEELKTEFDVDERTTLEDVNEQLIIGNQFLSEIKSKLYLIIVILVYIAFVVS